MNDRVFLKLARKVGYPSATNVARLRKLQVERAKKGDEPTLLQLARDEDVLSAKERRNYDRWAEQIGAKTKNALIEEDEQAPPVGGALSGRIVMPSAEEIIDDADEEAKGDLDEIITKRERESTPDLADRVFLKLSKKVGYPSGAEVSKLRKIQVGRKEDVSLFQLAREEKLFSAKQQKNYDRWAKQIGAKAKAALVEDEESTATAGTVSGRVVAHSAEEVELDGDEAKADLDDLIGKLAPKVDLADRVFLKLAKRASYPSSDELAKLRKLQVAHKEDVSLFRLAREERIFSAKQQKNYDRWAEQIAAKAKAALVEDEESAPTSGAVSGRVVVPSTEEVEVSGEEATADLDDLITRFSTKKDEPKAVARPASAGKLRTPSAGRERAAKGGPRPAATPTTAISLAAVAAILAVLIVLAANGGAAKTEPEPSVASVTATKPAVKTTPAPGTEPTDGRVKPRGLFGPGTDTPDATPEMDSREQARVLVEQARALLEQGDDDGARSCIEEARALDAACPGLDDVARRIPPPKKTAEPTSATPGSRPVVDPGMPKPADDPAKKPLLPTPPKDPKGADPKGADPKATPAAPGTPKPGEPVVERAADGKVKAKYGTDSKGRRHGDYAEYHENGKPSVRAKYVAGERHGPYSEFFANGKSKKKAEYRKDQLHGRVIEWDQAGKVTVDALWNEGEVIYPRSAALISAMLSEIEHSPVDAPEPPKGRKVEFAPMDAQTQARPLRRLRQHRYLVGVPWDVDLSFEYGEYATAGSKLLDLIQRLDHTPVKPEGCSEALYALGYKGTSQGNLYMGVSDLNQCIDGWIDDSDQKNIDRVGHRRWCLNPSMKKTAIGQQSAKWTVLHAHDQSRTSFEEPSMTLYPARGLFPTTHIHADAAWSISLNSKFAAPVKEAVTVTVRPCDERMRKGAPLETEYFTVNNDGFGQPYCIIFRMKAMSYRAGSGYWVDVKGVKEADGKPYPIGYYVELFEPSR